jgi:predicted Zn-dependent protease with MMP-like domain
MVKRRRGSQRAMARRPGIRPARHSPFEVLVSRALAAIPEPFAARLREVAVIIDDEPSAELRRLERLGPDDTLYGIFEPADAEWGSGWVREPDRIRIFRLPLEADFPDPDDLAEEVRITVMHELAHQLGIDDDRLDELGLD